MAAVIGFAAVGRAAVAVEAVGIGISVEMKRFDFADPGGEQAMDDVARQVEMRLAGRALGEEAGVGRVVGTTFGKSSVYAHRQGDGYCLLLRRSFADYIWRYLVRASVPYGLAIVDFDSSGHAGQGVAA